MDFNKIKNMFNELLERKLDNPNKEEKTQAKRDRIALLEPLLERDDLTVKQKIFAYWNISDNYALLREHEKTYENHLKFEEFLNDKNANYKLMLIVDATQRLSITAAGHEDYWIKLYFDLTDNLEITKENYIVYFEVLRSALYKHNLLKKYNEVAENALMKMKDFLEKQKNDVNYPWFRMIYYDSLLKYNGIKSHKYIEEAFEAFLDIVRFLNIEEIDKKASIDEYNEELFGTYASANRTRPMYVQARCVQNFIITLIDLEMYDLAKKCYDIVGEKEFQSLYFNKKIKILKEHCKNSINS